MAWIKEISPEKATGKLKQVYQKLAKQRGKVSNIMKVHSLMPSAMDLHLQLYVELMFSKTGLHRAEREMLAVLVSCLNQCEYCVNHHAMALNFYWKDLHKIKSFIDNPQSISPNDREQALIKYATKLTRYPGEITPKDIDALRTVGLSDEEILQTNLIVSYFNFVNRIANGLGVEFTEDEVAGYKY